MANRKRTREQRSLSKGRPFLVMRELPAHRIHSQINKLIYNDLFLRSQLTEGQIYFMRFVGVVTSRDWIVDDNYRAWSRERYGQLCNLKRMWAEGAARIAKRKLAVA